MASWAPDWIPFSLIRKSGVERLLSSGFVSGVEKSCINGTFPSKIRFHESRSRRVTSAAFVDAG
jgi:hypothetical protein